MSAAQELASSTEAWLRPLTEGATEGDAACGPDLGYDNDFLALTQAAAGKPASALGGEGEPPDWRGARRQAEALFERTRDLRVALIWSRAVVQMEGLVALAPALRLCQGLLANFPQALHPRADPDDGAQYERGNALAALTTFDGMLGDLRAGVVAELRGLPPLRGRDCEIALGTLGAREGETSHSREQVTLMLGTAIDAGQPVREVLADARLALTELAATVDSAMDSADAPDFTPLRQWLAALSTLMPAAEQGAAASVDATPEGGAPAVADAAGAPAALSGAIRSRQDAVRAILMVCEYLERAEPSNPAQLLLRRAARLLNHNFLQLVRDLAPDALAEVAKIMGVDPSTIELPLNEG